MAANQAEPKTSKKPSRSSNRPQAPWVLRYCCTFVGLSGRCGSSEPGTAATASRNNSTSAVRMLINRRQSRRAVRLTSFTGPCGGV